MSSPIDLKKETKSGASWTMLASLVSSVCQLGIIIILSRYLSHSDFGLMAIALFVINFSQIFVDIGISNAIIHKQDIKKKELDSLYWLNIIMGLVIFIILNLLSGQISDFYNNPKLKNVLFVISFTFIIQPFGAQFNVLLRKYLDFKSLSIRTIVAQVIGFIVGLILAFKNQGVYSLVFSNLATTVVGTILVIGIGLKSHKPSLYFSIKKIKPHLSFGFYQLGEKLMNYLNSDLDTLIIGRFIGVESLGVYSIAKNFISKPYQVINPILTRIGFPLMAKVQNDNKALQKFYGDITKILSLINFPIYLFVFAYPSEIVYLVFGENWDEAIIPLQILSLCYLFRSTMNPIGSLQLAKGKANYGFYWNLIQFIALPFLVYGFSFWGIIGVCLALTGFQLVMFSIIGKVMVKRLCEMDVKKYYLIFLKPTLFSIAAILFSSILERFQLDISLLNKIVLVGLLFSVFYMSLLCVFERKTITYWLK